MKSLGLTIAGISLLWSLGGLAQEGEPSLEDLEQMGSELNAVPSQPMEAMGDSAVDLGADAAPAMPAARNTDLPAVPEVTGLQEIDIRSQIRKVSEPNLFAGVAPLPGTLRNLALGEAPEEYEVQEGDNLFDICDQLLDEADYWPKLWSFNPAIANPHFVFPGMKLRFYAGDADNPPFLRVVTEDEILPVNKGGLVESELVREDLSGMLMRSELPENMQVLSGDQLESVPEIDAMFVLAGNDRRGADELRLIVPAFIVAEPFPTLGTVVGGSAGSYLLDKGNEVIVTEEDEGTLQAGTSYSIVRELGPIYTVQGGDRVGYRYEFIAQVKVNTKSENTLKGRVLFNRLGVQPGDRIIAYRSVKRSVPMELPTSSRGGGQQVVAFSEPDMQLGGRGAYVFIDQTAGKLQENTAYELMQNVKTSASSFIRDDLPDSDHQVGSVYIIDSSGSAAIGYITRDAFEIRLGDRIK